MTSKSWIIIALMMCVTVDCADAAADLDLARLLAGSRTRKSAVTKIVSSGSEKVPLLLSWTRRPPASVNEYELYIGLADAFGHLKTKEAIPFLVMHISLNRFLFTDVWTRTPDEVEDRLAAVGALIQIGPESSMAVIQSYKDFKSVEVRLAAIFVVSRLA